MISQQHCMCHAKRHSSPASLQRATCRSCTVTLYSQCLSPPSIQMGSNKFNTGVTSIPLSGEQSLYVIETGINSSLLGPSGSHANFNFLHDYEYIFLVGLQKVLNIVINIAGDRAKMNKLVQMAWTFSNDRFVCLLLLLLLFVIKHRYL